MTASTPAQAPAPPDAPDTRSRILRTAARMFGERGYDGTSIRDISEELGVTKAALYYHFTSKDAILHAIVDEPLSRIREVMAHEWDLRTREGRRAFTTEVVEAMASCHPETVTVFKDPRLGAIVNAEVQKSSVTQNLAVRLAMGLSGVDDPARVEPDHMVRAITAVGAAHAAIDNWHVIYPDCDVFDDRATNTFVQIVTDNLERE